MRKVVAGVGSGVVMGVLVASAAGLLLGAGSQPAAPAEALDADMRFARSLSNAFRRAAETIEPSVVHITTEARVPQYARNIFNQPLRLRDRVKSGLGSGVIVDGSGLILTNHHVVEDAESLTVRLFDGRELPATLLGSDQATDIAVLRIEASGLTAARLGDSDGVGVGEWVLAIGSPFGLEQTVTAGIISAKGRSLPGEADDRFGEFIQTDASINPGNSGGPLVTLDGEVIGINSAIISSTRQSAGLGFAVPSAIARAVMDSIVQDGVLERGWLGVGMEDLAPERRTELGLRPGEGVVLTGIVPASPADRAGLREGDIVVRVSGREVVGGSNRLRNLIALNSPGTELDVEVLREGRRQTLRASLIDPEEGRLLSLGAVEVRAIGVQAVATTPEISRQLGYQRHVPGVVVVGLVPGGVAERAGLRADDIIVEVDGRDVRSPEDLATRLERAGREGVRVDLVREGLRGYVELEPG